MFMILIHHHFIITCGNSRINITYQLSRPSQNSTKRLIESLKWDTIESMLKLIFPLSPYILSLLLKLMIISHHSRRTNIISWDIKLKNTRHSIKFRHFPSIICCSKLYQEWYNHLHDYQYPNKYSVSNHRKYCCRLWLFRKRIYFNRWIIFYLLSNFHD